MALIGSAGRFVSFLILLMWAGVTYRQARMWSSDISIWENAVQSATLRPGDHFALAVAYQQHQRFREARREYAQVMHLTTDRNWSFAVAFNLAEMLSLEGKPDKAMILLEQLLEGYPEQEYPIRYFERAVLLNAGMDCETVLLIHSGPRTVCASF